MNPCWQKMFGYSSDEARCLTYHDVTLAEDVDVWKEMHQKLGTSLPNYGHVFRVYAPKGHTVNSRRFQPTETGSMHRAVDPEGVHYLGRPCIVAAQWAIRGTVGANGIRIGRPLQGECRISLRPETITNQRWPVSGHCTIRDSIYEIVYLAAAKRTFSGLKSATSEKTEPSFGVI